MGCDISKRKINGSIVLELNKKDKNQFQDGFLGGEEFIVQIHYCFDKPDIKINLKYYAIVEIIVKDQVQRKIILSGPNHIIQPNNIVRDQQYEDTVQFQSCCPQIASAIVQTGNPNKQIRITNHLEASFINQKNKELKPKINQVLEMNIKRTFGFPSTLLLKTLDLPLKSWKWGDYQCAQVNYCFQDRQFQAGNIIFFTLFVNNMNTTITIENIKVFLVFEILERKDRHWKLLSRQIMWSGATNQRICFGTNPPEMSFQIPIPPCCVSSLYHFDFQMQYHVEIIFENEYNYFQKNSYTERILIDVVN